MMVDPVKVLVVEDVEIAQKIANITLMALGCSVDIAENGQKALQLFKDNQYDLIFMDIGLPDISGIVVTKAIRRVENNESHVPIIALTANYDESHPHVCFDAGMDEFMLKPLTKENGQAMINKFIT